MLVTQNGTAYVTATFSQVTEVACPDSTTSSWLIPNSTVPTMSVVMTDRVRCGRVHTIVRASPGVDQVAGSRGRLATHQGRDLRSRVAGRRPVSMCIIIMPFPVSLDRPPCGRTAVGWIAETQTAEVLRREGITVLEGRARIRSERRVEVDGTAIGAGRLIIATGYEAGGAADRGSCGWAVPDQPRRCGT